MEKAKAYRGVFKLGLTTEASAAGKARPHNNHVYLGTRHFSFSPRSWFFPVRLAMGLDDMGGGCFFSVGLLRWSLVLEFQNKKLIKRLKLLGARVYKSRLIVKVENVGKLKPVCSLPSPDRVGV